MKIKHLVVTTPQGTAGDLRKDARYTFTPIDPDQSRQPSLTMSPTVPVRSGALPPIFEMNLPEGYLRDRIQKRYAGQVGRVDEMWLLARLGAAQIGRLNLTQPEEPPQPRRRQIGLTEILRHRSGEVFDFLTATYLDSGISGFQPKVLVPDADRSVSADNNREPAPPELIVKSSTGEYRDLCQNEFMCLSAARAAGIQTPRFWLSDDGGLLVLERFDLDARGPLGFEEMNVLLGKRVFQKHEGSYETVAKAVRWFCAEADPQTSLRQLFEYIAFTVMVGNGDGHLKNFGLLYDHPGNRRSVRLAPLYDVVTTTIYGLGYSQTNSIIYDRTLALRLRKSRRYPDLASLSAFGRDHCSVARPEDIVEKIAGALSETLKELQARVPDWLSRELLKAWRPPRRR